ncbi:hypothetical protein OsJ_33183 [Oryza sativa Japonica Group]|uniref:At1g34320 n=3 Tax=Oryza TaxID=4527 RepID=A0A979HK59_ORYSJ|nr:At1g34320 [Oryza sativa Japonica Group]ABA91788.1 expressed protein [Oryza sativa Japonica Group]EAZ17647.1 hypothetical protein OsJ_33183 [Oryza sativa Japonica Group]
MKMSRFCSVVGIVCGSPSSSGDEAFASHGEQQQATTTTTAQSSGKSSSSRRKTAPEASGEHKAGGEAPPPASKKTALLDKGKEKVSEMDTSVRRTSKGISGNPSEDSNEPVAKSPTLKTVIGSIRNYIATKKGRKIKILAFEVANTIAMGSNLMNFLSEENIRYLKRVVLQNQGVQSLISDDQSQLLALVGDEIRQQFKDFAASVARLGNMCRDPKWHNLEGHFSGLEYGPITQEYSHEKAASKMEDLMELVTKTKILFEALRRLGVSEKMYREAKQTGMPLETFQNAVNIEKEIVQSAKKKALWVKKIEKIVEELVYIVHYLPSEINCVFYKEHEEDRSVKANGSPQQTLGSADLQLNYARIVIAIQVLVSVASSVPQCAVDSLFHALPYRIRSVLLPRMRHGDFDDQRTETQIADEMTRRLEWLYPMAEFTIRLSQHTGMIRECLVSGSLSDRDQRKMLKVQTLYHADKMKTDGCIIDMVMDLHLLIKAARLRADAPHHSGPLDQPVSTSGSSTSSASTGISGSTSFGNISTTWSDIDEDFIAVID